MKLLVTMQHPAHFHLFKHAIAQLKTDGHEVLVLVREKDVLLDLLEEHGLEHEVLAGPQSGRLGVLRTQAVYEFQILRRARQFRPDVLLAVGEPSIAHASRLFGGKSVLFTDTETATISNAIAVPFADVVCTPDCYQTDHGTKQVRYPGYHELAYLHPSRFAPDPSVVEDLGLDPTEKIAFVRSISWHAIHDIAEGGVEDVAGLITALEETGATVLVSSEVPLPPELSDYAIDINPADVHSLLYYSDLFVGESATMASESAVLGTPAVYVATASRGYIDELDERYGLVFSYTGPDRQTRSIEKATEILSSDGEDFASRHERMLKEKCDTTDVILEQVYRAAGVGREPAQTAPEQVSGYSP